MVIWTWAGNIKPKKQTKKLLFKYVVCIST